MASCCLTTDYRVGPQPTRPAQLRAVAEAGFDHIHWCWDWCDNVVYGPAGRGQISEWLAASGLRLLDCHGAIVAEAREYSRDPTQRAAGLALHVDRLALCAELGGDVVVLHPPEGDGEQLVAATEEMVAALSELLPVVQSSGVRLAIENTWPAERNRVVLSRLFAAFGPEVLGYCYDSGHANMAGDREWLVAHAFERLAAVHLHDNDGSADQHLLPGDGTVPWPAVVQSLRQAGYEKPYNLEVVMSERYGTDEHAFLGLARQRASVHLGL